MMTELNEAKIQAKVSHEAAETLNQKLSELETKLGAAEVNLQHFQQDKESLQEERASIRAQNEAMSEQILQMQTKMVGLAHTESSNDDLVNQIGVLTNDNTKLQHEVERLTSVVQRKKDKKRQAIQEAKDIRAQLSDEQGASAKIKIDLEQTKMDLAGKDDQIKDLREQTDRLSAKIREEMQSVKYWMNDHKQLTEELDEEHDTHRKTMARMEGNVFSMQGGCTENGRWMYWSWCSLLGHLLC